ncbi:hypothetical protein [Geothrix limicola]|uniref:hypothetical protein n=1 Tax=Geothrix limicola TaxID=2927978 RepID=UPI0025578BCE|nr:hypothetical protein [Geothrix limicola]
MNGQGAAGILPSHLEPALEAMGKFEGAVLHQLGPEASVRGEIDVFKKNTPHGGVDGGAGLVCIHRQSGCGHAWMLAWNLGRQPRNACRQYEEERKEGGSHEQPCRPAGVAESEKNDGKDRSASRHFEAI